MRVELKLITKYAVAFFFSQKPNSIFRFGNSFIVLFWLIFREIVPVVGFSVKKCCRLRVKVITSHRQTDPSKQCKELRRDPLLDSNRPHLIEGSSGFSLDAFDVCNRKPDRINHFPFGMHSYNIGQTVKELKFYIELPEQKRLIKTRDEFILTSKRKHSF